MEVSMFRGFTDLGMDDLSFIHQQVNSLEELFRPTTPISPSPALYTCNNFQQYNGITTTMSNTNQILSWKACSPVQLSDQVLERPAKQLKTDHWNLSYDNNDKIITEQVLNSSPDSSVTTNTNILSFANSSSCSNQFAGGVVTPKEEAAVSTVTFPSDMLGYNVLEAPPQDVKKNVSSSTSRMQSQSQTRDHIIAERKRREKLSQRFIALSAIVPGLKKMDKASVLADAIKYMKQLQERVKTLEEQAKKKTVESAVFVKKSRVFADDDDSLSAVQETFSDDSCPEIEARFADKDVLLRIHCERKNGVLEKLITHVEKLNLVVSNSSALAFTSSALDVTIIAQMGNEFSMTAEDLVRNLHAALKPLM